MLFGFHCLAYGALFSAFGVRVVWRVLRWIVSWQRTWLWRVRSGTVVVVVVVVAVAVIVAVIVVGVDSLTWLWRVLSGIAVVAIVVVAVAVVEAHVVVARPLASEPVDLAVGLVRVLEGVRVHFVRRDDLQRKAAGVRGREASLVGNGNGHVPMDTRRASIFTG